MPVGATDEEVPLSEPLASPEVSVGVAVRVIRETVSRANRQNHQKWDAIPAPYPTD
ncbi:MAG UNVERIFIED_CONTAM: hypothetical protein LVT10_19830 [Anaerolineae bacterium]